MEINKKIKILFLDDDPIRHTCYTEKTEKYLNTETYHAWRFDDCINLLCTHKFDIICLDHDLGLSVNTPYISWEDYTSKLKTGADVARWIADNAIKTRRIIIHSWNAVGAASMASLLNHLNVIRREFGRGFFSALDKAICDVRFS